MTCCASSAALPRMQRAVATRRVLRPMLAEFASSARPHCERCGLPFATTGAGHALRRVPRASAALCPGALVLSYDEEAAAGPALKHGDRRTARSCGAWMAAPGPTFRRNRPVARCPSLARLFTRRYNQAALLARMVARDADAAFVPDLLRRARCHRFAGRSQGQGTPAQCPPGLRCAAALAGETPGPGRSFLSTTC